MSNRPTPAVSGRRLYMPDVPPPSIYKRLATFLNRPDAQEIIDSIPGMGERIDQFAELLETVRVGFAWFDTGDRIGPKYGLTGEDFWRIVYGQGFGCAICGVEFMPGGARMMVDHNHDTGDVRGVLCSHCNLGLGIFKDSPTRLRGALKYLAERGHYGPDEGEPG